MNRRRTISDPAVETGPLAEAYLARIKNLPPTPTVLIKLIDLFRQRDVDVDDIVQLIRRDPALSVELLRACNHSFFCGDSAIKDVNEAVYRLGFYEVYQLTVRLFGMRILTTPGEGSGFPAAELRRHSSIAAIAAGALAREVGVPEGVAFTTALLHDLGKLAFGLAEPARYVALLNHCKLTGASLSQLESERFGFTHGELGAQLLRHWGMSEEVAQPVAGHADAASPEKSEALLVLTRAASELANHVESHPRGKFSGTATGKALMEFFGLPGAEIDTWEHFVRGRIKHFDSTKPL